MSTYQNAPAEVLAMVKAVMQEHHPDLCRVEAKVDVLMAYAKVNGRTGEPSGPALKLSGYPCLATIKITSVKNRLRGLGDALMCIDGDRWDYLQAAEQRALIDHELEHLQVRWDVAPDPAAEIEGLPKSDDAGRPKLMSKLHDWQLGGFATVAQRHGGNALEVQAIHETMDQFGQYLMFEDDPAAAHATADAEAEGERAA